MPYRFENYSANVDWLITWFPHRLRSRHTQQTRAGSAHQDTGSLFPPSAPFPSPNSVTYLMGQGSSVDDPLHRSSIVTGWLTLSLTEDIIFEVSLRIQLGSASRTQSFLARPRERIPFMIAVAGRDDTEVDGTSLAAHGTIVTGSRPVDRVLEQVRIMGR